ncbi:MAG TPA: 30S ribosomal protein S18 [Patescibacteria group bacterium]|nr:30S ribosomal protein S18 [Patescibacteria group bacterium]
MKKKKRQIKKKITTTRKCYYCENNKEPLFSDTATLQKFVTERGKIVSRSKNGLCARHQRRVAIAIKYARHLALMPFVARV